MSKVPHQSREVDTVRELPKAPVLPRDTVPEPQGVYVPPRPLAQISDHRTIQIKPVIVVDDGDPRRAKTQLRLSPPPPAPAPPSALPLSPTYLVPLGLAALAIGGLAGFLWVQSTTPASEGPAIEEGKLAPETVPANAPEAARVPAPPPEGTAEQQAPNSSEPPAATETVTAAAPSPEPPSRIASPPAGGKVDAPAKVRKKTRDPWLD